MRRRCWTMLDTGMALSCLSSKMLWYFIFSPANRGLSQFPASAGNTACFQFQSLLKGRAHHKLMTPACWIFFSYFHMLILLKLGDGQAADPGERRRVSSTTRREPKEEEKESHNLVLLHLHGSDRCRVCAAHSCAGWKWPRHSAAGRGWELDCRTGPARSLLFFSDPRTVCCRC